MDRNEFERKLTAILHKTNDEVVELVFQARNENADGLDGSKPVPYADDPNWQYEADGFAEICAWIYDRMNGKSRLDKRSMSKKIRRVLGYTHP